MVHAPASVATPPVAPSTPFPSAIHPESQPAVQAPPDPREALVVGLDTRARTDGPSSNAVAGGLGRAVNGGAGMNASARAHSPPIWNVNSLLPGNPDVHIRTPAHPTVADATGVGGQPQASAGNAGRGAGASGNAVRGRGTGARGNAGRGTGERGNAARGRGARRRGGRASAGRGTGVGSNEYSANGQGAHGVTGNDGRGSGVNANGGSGNGPVNRPRIRRRRVDVVLHMARNGSREGSERASDEDDEDDADDANDSWNDDDENYLSNSLSALNEEEAEDNERVRGTRRDIEKYRGWANEYKRFMAHELPKLDAGRFGDEAALRNANPDEIGAALEQIMGGDWKMAEGDELWFHGPETNPWRLRKYVTFLANETVAQADRMATLKRPEKTLKKRRQCTPAMLMGRLKALNLLIKLDGAIFRKPVLNLLRDFAECRIWVRVQVRDRYKRFIAEHMDRHRGTAADTYTPDEFKHMMPTLLWLRWVYDLVPILYKDIAPPLDFTEPSTWYDQYLFFPLRAGNEKKIPPTTHHDWAAKILQDAGITCSRAVHATRAGGAQHASLDGMPSDQLARLGGRRFIDVMTKHYLTTIPREAVLLKAGFTGVDGDNFLGRTTVPVRDKLDELPRKHIFPWAAADKGEQQCKDYNRRMVKKQKPEKQDTAGLNILKELDGDARMAVAQDLAMYYIHQPRHPYVVNNPLCQTKEFASWAANVSLANQLAIVQRNTPTLTQPAVRDDIAVVLDKLDLMSGAVGMSGVSEGIAVKKKSVDLELSQLKKGSPVEVQLRVKWMLVRDRLINASLPASEFTVAWPQYCALMPDLQ
ncbi:unnamed protein product [Closterium sp. NIES-64]|nr:unnamed protein product [Closterium sp. NIES-64]